MSSPNLPSSSTPDDPTRKQKRKRLPRALLACESCRTRKLRCDQLAPCTNCSKRSLNCEYRSLEIPLPSAAARQSESHHANPYYEDPSKRRNISVPSTSRSALQSNLASLSNPPEKAGLNLNLPSLQPQRSSQTPYPDVGFEEVNRHTQGTEYYGPVSVYSFLRRLQSRAHNQRLKVTEKVGHRTTRDARDVSIVNLLHSSDFPISSPANSDASPQTHSISQQNDASTTQSAARSSSTTSTLLDRPGGLTFPRLSNIDIERECVRLFFVNLHVIHPMLDKAKFLERCEIEIWRTPPVQDPVPTVFLALYNAVLAVGAINAGEDASFMRDTTSVRQAERYASGPKHQTPTYPPLKLAKLFFERAKSNLGDVFEACSLESTQALMLMAVFCQNALKPHSCYLYCGMAVRCALAVGLANYSGPDVIRASITWWGLYSFEIEMCATAGRESSLREAEHYRVPLPNVADPDDLMQSFHTEMIGLAQITADLALETADPDFSELLPQKSQSCLNIDRRLEAWKNQLPPGLNFEATSLVEPEWVAKQKAVLRNRFLNCRILIHRPFLIAATAATTSSDGDHAYSAHVSACVTASVLTIEALYEMYKHRPYFRTWWYNTTYTLYASMILLYVILSNLAIESLIPRYNRDYLIQVVQQSLEIFQSMDMVAVARRCVEVTQEVLDVAKRAPPQNSTTAKSSIDPLLTHEASATTTENSDTFNLAALGDDPLGGLDLLVDPNLMEGFAPFSVMMGESPFDYLDFNSVLASGPFG